jgi:hypothetical protein
MAHFDRADRGVYEPGEDVRVFDGSEDEEDAEGSRLPLLIVLALLVLAMFAGVVWLAYTQGVARGRTETPILTAENGPARVAPQNPGGTEQSYKGFKIYEQPAPPDEDAAASSMAPAPAAKPAPAKPAAAAPVKPAAQPPAVAPKATAAMPAPAKAPAPAAAPKVVAAAPAKPPAAALVPAKAPAPIAASSAYALQIGAYKSQAEADAAWKAYKGRHAALLADASTDVQQADLGDKGVWYRLRITGFASKDVANAMCDRLKGDGGACFLGH